MKETFVNLFGFSSFRFRLDQLDRFLFFEIVVFKIQNSGNQIATLGRFLGRSFFRFVFRLFEIENVCDDFVERCSLCSAEIEQLTFVQRGLAQLASGGNGGTCEDRRILNKKLSY